MLITCLFRDCYFPGSKSSPNITVHHIYSHFARRYTSFALQIIDVDFWWPSPSFSYMIGSQRTISETTSSSIRIRIPIGKVQQTSRIDV